MAKRLRQDRPIYIAPDIWGVLNGSEPYVIDERNKNTKLDPRNIDDKITIYERQVMDWFLNPAQKLSRYRNRNKGFIVLMICLSYIEGVEQYRKGQSSNGQSRNFFISSMNRIYQNQFSPQDLGDLYREARSGLFHNGMVQGRIIINNSFLRSLAFNNGDIEISPSKFLRDIRNDFQNYIRDLRDQNNFELRINFNNMFSNL
jgi:hypothetical protein